MAALAVCACSVYRPQPLTGPELERILNAQPPFDRSRRLTGDALAALAVLANPDLRACAPAGGRRCTGVQSGLLPDPQASLGFDKVLSPKDQGLISAYTGSLSLDILRARHAPHGTRDKTGRGSQGAQRHCLGGVEHGGPGAVARAAALLSIPGGRFGSRSSGRGGLGSTASFDGRRDGGSER